MIGRIIWLAILLVFALVSSGVQLDREARKTPALALQVPELFRSGAQPRLTVLAINSGAAELGVAEAQKLVRRRPIPARHLRSLAQAQIIAGNNEASALAIQYAAQRGWRDSLTQEAMMRLALAAGDRPEAARRYAALFLNRRIKQTLLVEAGVAVFPDVGGEERAILAEIVAGSERWRSAFAARGAAVIPPSAFVEIVGQSIADGAEFDCGSIAIAVGTLARKDQNASKRLTLLTEPICPKR
ncbi:MAG: hypothetical protein ABJ205_02875 [Erythrobacter sp.]|uniref:hypothetical protein n=1 Tax=Erythrobacter sp. TaxID=1042 RepID=UPI0032641319